MPARKKITLDRRKVVASILKQRDDLLLVTGLGAPTWDAASVEDTPNNFYLWGGMTVFWFSIGAYVLYISSKFTQLSEK